MNQYVVLLRGINVGGVKLAMGDLRSLASRLQYQDPVTIGNTGNLLIRSGDTAQEIRDRMTEALGVLTGRLLPCLVRSQIQIAGALREARQPPPEFHHYLLFCQAPLFEELAAHYAAYPHEEGEALYAGVTDIHWVVRRGNTLSGFGAKVLGKDAYRDLLTSRNLNTVEKIAAGFDRR
ncbi:MAG: DUF1697 domain-containing protein [Christensenellales bacterium]